jgi:hypothetical protein
MNGIVKSSTLLLILTLVLSLSAFMMGTASATDPPAPTYPPDIPKPSVPQFTLTYADHSYDVPPKTTQSTDPYTGKVTTNTISGYRVKNFTIDINIKNQPYPPTVNHGNASTLKCYIQGKGHYESDDHFLISGDGTDGAFVASSNSEYTLFSMPISITEGAVDVRVQASLGYEYPYYFGFMQMGGWASAGSDWSAVQTINIGDSTPFPMPTATVTTAPSPAPIQTYSTATTAPTIQSDNNSNAGFEVPQLNWFEVGAFGVLGLIVVVLAVFLALSRRKIKALERRPVVSYWFFW